MSETPIIIVGAGLAGLCCARTLHRHGLPFLLLEADAQPGGRVRTDAVNGFLLDHGFQVFLTTYPEARSVLDYSALGLRAFAPGAYVRVKRGYYRVSDPYRDFAGSLRSITAPIGSLRDKLLVSKLRKQVTSGSLHKIFARPESTTEQRLRDFGFSETMIDRFFRPFFGGILLDPQLQPSSRMFDFVFRMLSLGDTTLPRDGMGAIPAHIAAGLPSSQIRYLTPVEAVSAHEVQLISGARLAARHVVLATDAPHAQLLTDGAVAIPASRTSMCVYYAASRPPYRSPHLVLNGNHPGERLEGTTASASRASGELVNTVAVLSNVQPTYAPRGQHLISASIVGQPAADSDVWEPIVRRELRGWFGKQVDRWTHLRTYQIRHAQPAQSLEAGECRPVREPGGLYVCGDHRANPSINGAMLSGRRAAEAVIEDWNA